MFLNWKIFLKHFYIIFQDWLSENESSDVFSEKQQQEKYRSFAFWKESNFRVFSRRGKHDNSVYTQVHTARTRTRTHIYIRAYTIKYTLGYTDRNRIDSDRELTEWKKKKFIYFFYISLSSSHLSTLFSKTMMWKVLWNFRKRDMRNISQSCVFKARKGNGQKKILDTWEWKKLQEIVRNPNWKQTLYQRKIR